MLVLGVILARAGSKGLPEKCLQPLRGRPLIEYTFDHARQGTVLSELVLSTDSPEAARLGRARGLRVIDRPAPLADDTATVDAAARHAVQQVEEERGSPVDVVVLLYGNIPVRAPGLIDRAVRRLLDSGADSVRSVAPVGRTHPDWMHRLDGDRLYPYRPNRIYRRQDLSPLYYHDAAVVAVTRAALFSPLALRGDPQAFLGRDRRALLQRPEDAIDVDEPFDLCVAEALLKTAGAAEPVLTT